MMKIVLSKLLLLCFTSLNLCVNLVICTTDTDIVTQLCSYTDFDRNSTYKDNLITLLSTLSSNSKQSSSNGYYATNTSSLRRPTIDHEIIYGLYLCRGDISSEECNKCVSVATQNAPPPQCQTDKGAVIWYNKCMVRYSNNSFLGTVDESVQVPYFNQHAALSSDTPAYTDQAGDALQSLAKQMSNTKSAMMGDKRYFATHVNQLKDSIVSVYTMLQCTPDLAPLDCERCLQIIINVISTSCEESKGCRMLNPSCNLRYEQYSFSELPMAPPPSTAPSLSLAPLKPPHLPISIPNNVSTLPRGKRGTNHESIVLKIALGCLVLVVVILVVVFVVLLLMKERRSSDVRRGNITMIGKSKRHQPNFDNGYVTSMDSLQYDLATLDVATNYFSDDNKIGEGGFGSVYKGTLQNGVEIAVKRLSQGSNQGLEQFKNEVVSVAKLQHRNLVKLLGFCLTSNEMLLVYEFACNKSLDLILFDSNRRRRLGWPARYKIINGIARGLSYLHEDCRRRIIHRDLKASNILLDDNMNPKISDFGLARNFSENQDQEHTARLAGTVGYMAPEYVEYGEISTKSDVYSFGVLVLEIISGKKISNRHAGLIKNLLTYAWKHWNEDTIALFVDECMEDAYSSEEAKRCIHLGLLCVQGDTEQRPSMIKIVSYLNSNVDLPTPQQPTLVSSVIVGSSSGTSERHSDPSHKTRSSTRSMSRTNQSTGRSSQSFPSLEDS